MQPLADPDHHEIGAANRRGTDDDVSDGRVDVGLRHRVHRQRTKKASSGFFPTSRALGVLAVVRAASPVPWLDSCESTIRKLPSAVSRPECKCVRQLLPFLKWPIPFGFQLRFGRAKHEGYFAALCVVRVTHWITTLCFWHCSSAELKSHLSPRFYWVKPATH